MKHIVIELLSLFRNKFKDVLCVILAFWYYSEQPGYNLMHVFGESHPLVIFLPGKQAAHGTR